MDTYHKLIIGEDKNLHLQSPFGSIVQRIHYHTEGARFEKKEFKRDEEEEDKQSEENNEFLFNDFKLTSCRKELENNMPRLSTGCRYINEFLKGGILAGRITEIFGESATGKTQFMMQLLLNAVLPQKLGGLGGKVFCMFTDKSMSERRFNEMKEYIIDQNAGNITSDDFDNNIMLRTVLKLDEFNAHMAYIEKN